MGPRPSTLTLAASGDTLTGTLVGDQGSREIENGRLEGENASWSIVAPQMGITIAFNAVLDGDALSGQAALGAFGSFPFEGVRA